MTGETAAQPLPDAEKFDRVQLLQNSIRILRKMESRLLVERWKPRESDHDVLAYVRAYAQLLTSVNSVAKDMELDEFRKELDAMKEAQ